MMQRIGVVAAPPVVTPPPPPPVSFGGTVQAAARSYVDKGVRGAAQTVAREIVRAVPVVGDLPIVGDLLGDLVGGLFGTKSKANWDRTMGRVYRAALLGLVPSVAGAESIIGQIKRAWVADGDSTGARFWDRVVEFFGVPTEKGGTKEGYASGAPLGSKSAEAQPGFKAGLARFIAAVG